MTMDNYQKICQKKLRFGNCLNLARKGQEFCWRHDGTPTKVERLEAEIAKLKDIADLAFDIHTRDPINVKERWGAMGNAAERLLIDKIEALRGE
jgi:hypothetical protein